jgi:hypothetical protein
MKMRSLEDFGPIVECLARERRTIMSFYNQIIFLYSALHFMVKSHYQAM